MSNLADYNTKVLEVKDLQQHFKVGTGKNKLKVKAVDGVNFTVYKKEVFGLVGESGCGKTTTGRTMIRLYRPTSGVVKLDGEVVGAGSGEQTKLLKQKRKDHKIDLLKLNQYKYDLYLIDQKYKKMHSDYNVKIEQLKAENAVAITKLNHDIIKYKSDLFEEKNSKIVKLETELFNLRVQISKVFNQTKNDSLIEYNNLVKGAELAYKRKQQGIKESAALTDESKNTYKATILEDYESKLKTLEEEFRPKIEASSKNLLDKKESKVQIKELKNAYKLEKTKIIDEHKKFVEELVKPDYNKIKENIASSKQKLKDEIQNIKNKQALLHKQKLQEKAQVNSSKIVNEDELQKLNENYDAFIKEQKEFIAIAKKNHFSSDAAARSLKMQMIFQDPISSLNPRMTVQEIVSEGLVINGEKDKALIREKVIAALKQVGLAPEYISRYPHEFSGGQRQRIGIARALIMNPSIIIADEPISALDVSIQAQVINLLKDLKEELDLTILFIAHDLSVVKFFCDRIAVMYYGKIVELAPADQLFAHPLHPYTQSLLSAIPHPDPDYEKTRKRVSYSPFMHDYSVDKPEFTEIYKGHFISANKKELKEMKKKLGEINEK